MSDHENLSNVGLFDEQTLRAEIVRVWGEHGAHVDVFDHIVRAALATRPQPVVCKCYPNPYDHYEDCPARAAVAGSVTPTTENDDGRES